MAIRPMDLAVVEVRAGLGQLAGVLERKGGRIHALVETDPVARQILRRRFPKATVARGT